MRKNLNKLATLALSGMMVMSMAVPAFAQDVTFEKRVHTDGKTLAPNTTFNFEVSSPAQAGTYKFTKDGVNYNEATKPGPANGVTITGATFAPVAKEFGKKNASDDFGMFKSNATIHVDENKFTDLGYYEYDMVEKNEKYEGIYYTESKFKIYVLKYIDEKDNNKVKFITNVVRVVRPDGTANGTADNTKVTGVDNMYGRETPPPETPDIPEVPFTPPVTPPGTPTPENPYDTTHEVTVRKKIFGSVANHSAKFELFVKVVPGSDKATNGSELYNVNKEGNANLNNILAFTANVESGPIVVGENDGFTITGLTAGDKVIVREGTTNNTYVMTAGAVAGKETHVSKVADVVDYTTNFNVYKDDAEVDIKNTKEAATPTGIVMNVAPYAMMLAVAGGLGVVFMNRKKEEE